MFNDRLPYDDGYCLLDPMLGDSVVVNGNSLYDYNADLINYEPVVATITNDLYSALRFFFYKRLELTYELEESENEIIQKGYEIFKKYLKGRKFGNECDNYGKNINKDLCDYILSKNISNHNLRCYFLNEIFECPIQNKYFFKYLSHGKQIHFKIFQAYDNDSLECCQHIFFFK